MDGFRGQTGYHSSVICDICQVFLIKHDLRHTFAVSPAMFQTRLEG